MIGYLDDLVLVPLGITIALWLPLAALTLTLVYRAVRGGAPSAHSGGPARPRLCRLVLSRVSGTVRATAPAAAASPFACVATGVAIVIENHNWADIAGNPAAPTSTAPSCHRLSHAKQYVTPQCLPGPPNSLWLAAGQGFGIDDRPPSAHHQPTADHLVARLDRVGSPWKSYQEGIDGARCPLPARPSLPRYVRSLCPDLKQGDDWLATAVPHIRASPTYRRGGAIFIIWDEGAGGDGPSGLIALSPRARGGGYQNTIHSTHSALLATLQRIFGVGPPLGDAVNATDLRDLFVAPASSPRRDSAESPGTPDHASHFIFMSYLPPSRCGGCRTPRFGVDQ